MKRRTWRAAGPWAPSGAVGWRRPLPQRCQCTDVGSSVPRLRLIRLERKAISSGRMRAAEATGAHAESPGGSTGPSARVCEVGRARDVARRAVLLRPRHVERPAPEPRRHHPACWRLRGGGPDHQGAFGCALRPSLAPFGLLKARVAARRGGSWLSSRRHERRANGEYDGLPLHCQAGSAIEWTRYWRHLEAKSASEAAFCNTFFQSDRAVDLNDGRCGACAGQFENPYCRTAPPGAI